MSADHTSINLEDSATATIPAATAESHRVAAWAAIGSSIVGILAFASLFLYITTPAIQAHGTRIPTPMGRLLLALNFLGAALQAFLLMPVALRFDTPGHQRLPSIIKAASILGIAALIAVGILHVVPLISPAISDILFMGPTGFVGLWLIFMDATLVGPPRRGLSTLGIVAGIGLLVVGLNFFFNGGMEEFTHPYAYDGNVSFHKGLALGAFRLSYCFRSGPFCLAFKCCGNGNNETSERM
jgi:hypothetical protein